jgi:hypothetical protein
MSEKTSPIRYFDLQVLIACETNNVFPINAYGSHRIRAVTQRPEIETFDLTCHGVAIDQHDYVRFHSVRRACGQPA